MSEGSGCRVTGRCHSKRSARVYGLSGICCARVYIRGIHSYVTHVEHDCSLRCTQVRRQRGVMLDRVAELMQQGLFQQPVAEEVGLADFKQALQRQLGEQQPGKTLFKPG